MNWRVLQVDNDEEDYLIVRDLLSRAHDSPVTVQWAASLEAGLQALQAHAFDAVLVDYDLGGKTGFDLIRAAAARGIHTPMILVTGHGNYQVDVQAMQTGAADYLNKNEMSTNSLERSIRYAIERKRVTTERERLTDEIKTMTQQLWQTAKLATMGELAASLAHELNNPLAIVSLRIESLIDRSPDGSTERRELEVIQMEIDRMATLVANLLEFSRSDQRQVSSLNLSDEIRKTLDLMQSHFAHRKISVEMDFTADLPLIHADRQQMRQLFLNLFANASDAMPEGGALTIRMRPAGDAEHTLIEVQDTGIGIPAENLERVTSPFFSTKPEGKGTGLGLSICRRIVEEHHGSLQVFSGGPGKGATIQVTLPNLNTDTPAFG